MVPRIKDNRMLQDLVSQLKKQGFGASRIKEILRDRKILLSWITLLRLYNKC